MAKSETQKAHDSAWKSFSKYIRVRDKQCVTCGSENLPQAGHFWHNVLDFDEVNINRQCKQCNYYLSGNLAVYSIYLINKHGIKEFKSLEKRKYLALGGEKRSPEELREIAEVYKRKLETLHREQL